jgi:gas vesicle protein
MEEEINMPNREYDSRDTNQSRNEESSNSFLLGAIIGGVVGAAAALLLAPKSGKDFRNNFTNQAGTIIDKTANMRENVMTKSNELVSKGSTLSQGIVLQSTGLLNKVKGKISSKEETREEENLNYIPLQTSNEKIELKRSIPIGHLDSSEIRKRLEEAEKAFDEEEIKVKL